MDNIVTIEVFGETFRFRPESETVDSNRIAEHLKATVAEAEEQFEAGMHGKNKLAILLMAAMNISKEFHEMKAAYNRLEDYVDSRAASLIEKIDNGVQ